MLKIENYFLMLVLLLNLVNILNFTLSYANVGEQSLKSDLSLGLDVFFVLYYSFLLIFSACLFYTGRSLAGFTVLLIAIAPFIMEKSSTKVHKPEDFVKLRIKTLLVNLFIICFI